MREFLASILTVIAMGVLLIAYTLSGSRMAAAPAGVVQYDPQADGYQLARPATQISAAAILDALEGPVTLTDCSAGHGHCDIEATCRVSRVWQRLNLAIRRSLYEVSLAQLAGLDSTQVRLPELEREVKTGSARGTGRPGVNRHE